MIESRSVSFEFATAGRILFGAGRVREAGAIAAPLGRRALLVTGSSARAARRAEPVAESLQASGVTCVNWPVTGEPTLELVCTGAKRARGAGSDLVIGFGGGSAIDAGKAIAALLTNDGDPLDYLEVIGAGKPLTEPSAPFIAIPTTAGTGAEATRNAVLGSPEHRVKVSLRSPFMLPRFAIVDPELTLDLPPAITASTGLDALTQLIEPFVTRQANPLTDALCREGMQRSARSLRRACENGQDRVAREDLALASLLGGLALANAGLGAVHGFAGPLGGMFPKAPHGAICAALLPHVMEINLRVLRKRLDGSLALQRYDEVARILTGEGQASAADGVTWVKKLVEELKIPRLARYGVTEDDFPFLVEKAGQASSMKGNPVALSPGDLRGILERAL